MKNTYEIVMDYDCPLDICTITSKDDFIFARSIELEDGLIIDFDENNVPFSIELLDISERLGIERSQVKASSVQLKIIITNSFLDIAIDFSYRGPEQEFNRTIDSRFENSFNIPSIELFAS